MNPATDHETASRQPQAAWHRALPAVLALAAAMSAPLAAQAAEALRVVRDPVTGELRGPTAAEVTAFEKAEQQLRIKAGKPAKPAAPVEIRYPDGTIETKLGEDSMMYSVVKENGDGTLGMECLPAKQAQAFVKSNGKKAAATKAAVLDKNSGKTHQGHNHE